MADDDAPDGTPPAGDPPDDAQAASSDGGTQDGADTDDEVDVKALQAELRKTRREAAARRTRERELEAELAKRDEADLTEAERLKRRNAELEAKLAERDAEAERERRRKEIRTIASAKKSLDPDLVADLLVSTLGEDDDVGQAVDALLKSKPYLRAGSDTGGDANGSASAGRKVSEGDGEESDADRRARIFSGGGNIFDPAFARKQGGGVAIPGGEAQVRR